MRGNEYAVMMFVDRNYLPAALFVASQLAMQRRRNFDTIISVTDDVPLDDIPEIEGTAIVRGRLSSDTEQIPIEKKRTSAVFGRLDFYRNLPEQYRRVLYLDADVWIGRRSISDLFESDMGGYAIAAVADAAEFTRAASQDWRAYKIALGLSENTPYFNSGVMLIDRAEYVARRIGELSIEYLKAGRYRGKFNDQSALNAIACGNFLQLSPVWNWQFATRRRLTREVDPGVVHFIGYSKPWRDARARHDPKYAHAMRDVLEPLGYGTFVVAPKLVPRAIMSVGRVLESMGGALFARPRDRRIAKLLRQTQTA
jgi:lipopolysaccharide biosynthesis glycosyltransferase